MLYPYELKIKRWLLWYDYKIIYDKVAIYRVIGGIKHKDDMLSINAMLNGAYNSGRMHAYRETLGFEEGSKKFSETMEKERENTIEKFLGKFKQYNSMHHWMYW